MPLDYFEDRKAQYVTSDRLPYSYLIFRSGDRYFARSGETGQIEFMGTDVSAVIQSAINALSSGGVILLKEGAFEASSQVNLKPNVFICGQGEATKIKMGPGSYPNRSLFFLSGVSNVVIDGLNVEITASFPPYPAEYYIIRCESSSNLAFRGLHLKGKTDSVAGEYGVYVHNSSDVVIADSRAEYLMRHFNVAGSTRALIRNCQALHTPVNVDWSVVGFEIENGVSDVVLEDVYAYNIVDHRPGATLRHGYGITVKTHSADVKNHNVRIIRPTIKNCSRGFWLGGVENLVIKDMVADSLSVLLFAWSGVGVVKNWKIIGGRVSNTPASIEASAFWWQGLLIDGLKVESEPPGVVNVFYILGSGDPTIVDDLKIRNLTLIHSASSVTSALHLRNVNTAIIEGNYLSRAGINAIRLSGSYVKNVVIANNFLVGTIAREATVLDKITIRNNHGYPTDSFKYTGLSVAIGTGGAYGAKTSVYSPSGIISSFKLKITWGGTFGTGETVTVRVTAVYDDGTTTSITKSATAVGSVWLTDDDLLTLWKNWNAIRRLDVDATTNLSSTSVTVTVDVFGSG